MSTGDNPVLIGCGIVVWVVIICCILISATAPFWMGAAAIKYIFGG